MAPPFTLAVSLTTGHPHDQTYFGYLWLSLIPVFQAARAFQLNRSNAEGTKIFLKEKAVIDSAK